MAKRKEAPESDGSIGSDPKKLRHQRIHTSASLTPSQRMAAKGSKHGPKPILPFPKTPNHIPLIDTSGLCPILLEAAFTHSTYRHTATSQLLKNYERLEFYGDAYIQSISTELICQRYPDYQISDLAKCREKLVCNHSLSTYSRMLGFPERIRISPAHDKRLKEPELHNADLLIKLHADVLEAFVAVMIMSPGKGPNPPPDALSLGIKRATQFLAPFWEPLMQDVHKRLGRPTTINPETGKVIESQPSADNPYPTVGAAKTALGAKLNYRDFILLKYQAAERAKTDDFFKGMQVFTSSVCLHGWGYSGVELGRGQANTMLEAEGEAARDAVRKGSSDLMEAILKRRAEFIDFARVAKENGKDVREAYGYWVSQLPK
ncbi:MAG: hypothetical protein M1814_005830 [Vezdaea aestivalis]|nr:MAG: hypothetical protein M1814_005830 [Vezdaea aestivalis]